jgi:hypothetical protein
MKAAFYRELGSSDVLRIGELDTPEPGPGELRIRIKTSGVNPSDWKARKMGRGGDLPFDQVIPHSDGAGIIDAVGDGIDASRIGQKVWVLNAQYQRASGTAAEFVVLPQNLVFPMPDEADFAIVVDEDLSLPGYSCRPIAALRYQLVASKEYLAEHGTPGDPADLANHPLLLWRPPSGEHGFLHTVDGGRVPVKALLASSNERYLLYVAHAGNGIAYVPMPPIADPEFPNLVPLLADQIGRAINVQLVVPDVLAEVPRVKVVLKKLLSMIAK